MWNLYKFEINPAYSVAISEIINAEGIFVNISKVNVISKEEFCETIWNLNKIPFIICMTSFYTTLIFTF